MSSDLEYDSFAELDVVDEFVVDEQHDEDPWPHFVRAWLIAQRAANTAKTYATAELQWREYCAQRGLHPLQARRGDVDDWKQQIARHGGFHGRPASTNTIKLKLAAVSSLYAYLVGEDMLAASPAAHIKRPAVGDFAATAAMDPAQAARFAAAAQTLGPMPYVAVRILLGRGLRATELVGLDVSDVVEHFGYTTITVTHKGGKKQELPLSPATGHLIRTYIAEYLGGRSSGPLIVSSRGVRLTYWDLYNLIARISRRAKVGLPVTPHVLRAATPPSTSIRTARRSTGCRTVSVTSAWTTPSRTTAGPAPCPGWPGWPPPSRTPTCTSLPHKPRGNRTPA